MATREELLKRKAELEASMAGIRRVADEHNSTVGWWGYLTGDGVNLQEFNPTINQYSGGMAYKGDRPDYYDLSSELYSVNNSLAKLDDEERKAQIAASRANALTTNGLHRPTQVATTPLQPNSETNDQVMSFEELKQNIPQRFVDMAEQVTKPLMRPVQTTDNTVVPFAASTTSPTQTEQETKTDKTSKADKRVEVPTKKQGSQKISQTGNEQPMTFGNGNYVVPSDGFTSPAIHNATPITINPVTFDGDNGGLQHGAMDMLYRNTPATFGETLAFANLMQGKRGLSGGIGAITSTMNDIDKMNAYAAQGQVAGRVQDLLAQGYDMNEARYLALSEYGLKNGYDRMAVGVTMPEYAKYADESAKREMDTLAAMGGNYKARGALGYVPLGIDGFGATDDGHFSVRTRGQTITGIPKEAFLNGVYGAIKGDGSGSSNEATRTSKTFERVWNMEKAIADAKTAAEYARLGISTGGKGLSLDEKLIYEAAKHQHKMEQDRQKAELKGNKTGGSTSLPFVW